MMKIIKILNKAKDFLLFINPSIYIYITKRMQKYVFNQLESFIVSKLITKQQNNFRILIIL